MRSDFTQGLIVALVWLIGAACGVAFAVGLPVYDRQSVAPSELTVSAINDAHAKLNTLLVQGWEVERVVPEHIGTVDESTYLLRKPFWR